MHATFNRAPLPPRESAADEQKDDASPLPHQRTTTPAGFNSVDDMARAVPRTIGMAVGEVDKQGTDGITSLHAAAGFVEYTTEVEEMYEFTNSADLEWELFIEGLGTDYPSSATADVPAPIRNLFVVHAKKADSAIADFCHELRRGESCQDELTEQVYPCMNQMAVFILLEWHLAHRRLKFRTGVLVSRERGSSK